MIYQIRQFLRTLFEGTKEKYLYPIVLLNENRIIFKQKNYISLEYLKIVSKPLEQLQYPLKISLGTKSFSIDKLNDMIMLIECLKVELKIPVPILCFGGIRFERKVVDFEESPFDAVYSFEKKPLERSEAFSIQINNLELYQNFILNNDFLKQNKIITNLLYKDQVLIFLFYKILLQIKKIKPVINSDIDISINGYKFGIFCYLDDNSFFEEMLTSAYEQLYNSESNRIKYNLLLNNNRFIYYHFSMIRPFYTNIKS